MTTTVYAKNCHWCDTCLHDGWGDTPDDMTAEQFAGAVEDAGQRVVAAFHRRAQEAGRSDITWIPGVSEVWGAYHDDDLPALPDPDDSDYDSILDQWRVEAAQEVWDEFGDICEEIVKEEEVKHGR